MPLPFPYELENRNKDLRFVAFNNNIKKNIASIENVVRDEDLCKQLAKQCGDYVAFSTLQFNYEDRREKVYKFTQNVRTLTGTTCTFRANTPDSDDSGCSKGAKVLNPQVSLGEEVEAVLQPAVFFLLTPEIREVCIGAMITAIALNEVTLQEWGYNF